jgi:hypothetical protein
MTSAAATKRKIKLDPYRNERGIQFHARLHAGTIADHVAAFGFTRLIRSLLFGVAPTDPLTFTVIVLVVLTVALAASIVPASKAAAVNPLIALKGSE